MMKKNELLDISQHFALDLIRALTSLPQNPSNGVLTKQALRSGTSIGANIEEANGADSKKDFTRCLVIARKEARETRYWLRLLLATNSDRQSTFIELGETVTSLIKLLTTSVKTSKQTS